MNYLDLVTKTWHKCGCSGSPPATVVGQTTGDAGDIVAWVNDAWNDIQTAHEDWGWMRQTTTFTTVNGQGNYPFGTAAGQNGIVLTNFGMWVPDSSRNYVTATGTNSEIFMGDIAYETWRNRYQYGALRITPSRPMEIAVAPDKTLCLGPVSLAGYTVSRDYYTAPVELVADADIPALPLQFHRLIVYGAMKLYAFNKAAPEVMEEANENFTKYMRRLTKGRLPVPNWGSALA